MTFIFQIHSLVKLKCLSAESEMQKRVSQSRDSPTPTNTTDGLNLNIGPPRCFSLNLINC